MSVSESTKDGRFAESLIRARAHIPQSVVYRAFVKETVILNLESGLYHGVNPTGGRMLEALEKVGSLAEAAKILSKQYSVPLAEVEADLCEFCQGLEERGLLILDRQ